MPVNIDKLPRGLIALLGLRTSGLTPQLLADQAVGIIDLTQLYLLDTRLALTGFSNAAPAVGNNFYTTPATGFVVPAGELWYVWKYVVTTTAGAGAAIDLAASVNLDTPDLAVPVSSFGAAAATQHIRVSNDQPFLAGPGSQFGFLVRSVTLAPTISGAALVTRLKI